MILFLSASALFTLICIVFARIAVWPAPTAWLSYRAVTMVGLRALFAVGAVVSLIVLITVVRAGWNEDGSVLPEVAGMLIGAIGSVGYVRLLRILERRWARPSI